jgi:hypothetical protein
LKFIRDVFGQGVGLALAKGGGARRNYHRDTKKISFQIRCSYGRRNFTALTNLQMSRVKSHAEEAKLLRSAAEPLRDPALKTEEAKRRTFDELIAEIRGLKKGAFAPLTEQPFVRAIIVPSGGLGLLAVGQRLLDIF